MIKSWQDFIVEASYKRSSRGDVIEGTEDQIEDILERYAPWYNPLKIKMPLYRSVMVGSSSKPYYAYKVMDPKKFVRKPPTTENYYNVIIDNSDNWRDFPKRSRSIMTHTKESKTKLYGNKVYRVIPLRENAKCAYVDNDYWMAFRSLFNNWPFGKIESLNEFNQSLKEVFNLPNKDYSKDKLRSLLSSNNLNIESLSYLGTLDKWREKLLSIEKKNGSFYNWIDDQMIPNNTNVHLFDYNNDSIIDSSTNEFFIVSPKENGHEVWTDEKCLLIDDNILRKLYIKKSN